MIRALIFTFTTIAVSACGVKKTAAPPLGDLTYSVQSSCSASLDQRRNPVAGGVVDSGYFGKLIDRSDVNAILPADIPQTASHASNERLSLYVVSQGSCSVFSMLPFAPSHIYEYWKEAAGASGVSSLLGLYKEDCRERCKPDEVINPLVLLNACTDRWTMVHEIIHHNFNVQRKKFKPFDSDEAIIAVLMNELSVLQNVVDGYNRAPDEYQGLQLAHSLDRVRDLLVRFTYQTSFEEVSIESMLMREFASGRLQKVPPGAVKNAISYVRYSTAAGVDRLAPIRAAAEDLALSANQQGWSRVASNARIVKLKIDTFEDDSTCYQNEAVNIYRQATTIRYPESSETPQPTEESQDPHEPQEDNGDVIEWSHRTVDHENERAIAVSAHVDSHVDPRAVAITNKIQAVLSTIKK